MRGTAQLGVCAAARIWSEAGISVKVVAACPSGEEPCTICPESALNSRLVTAGAVSSALGFPAFAFVGASTILPLVLTVCGGDSWEGLPFSSAFLGTTG